MPAPILVAEVIDVGDIGTVPARAARAGVFAAVAVTLLLLLRAKSDGETPSALVLLLSFALVAAAAWALGSRERGAFAVLTSLVCTQLLLHVGYLFAATGQLAHSGGAGLFCSPATTAATGCAPTDRGGVVLLAVQLIVAVALAVCMRGADAACWQLARCPRVARFGALRRLFAIVAAAARLLPVDARGFLAPVEVEPRPPRVLLLAHECGRRGPPVRPVRLPLVAAPSFS